jgi:hypothetical protein
MEAGKYEFTIDSETLMQEGNIEVLMPAGATHSIKILEPNDSKILWLQVKKRIASLS